MVSPVNRAKLFVSIVVFHQRAKVCFENNEVTKPIHELQFNLVCCAKYVLTKKPMKTNKTLE